VNVTGTPESSLDGVSVADDQRDNEVFALQRFHEAYDIVRRATSRMLFKRTPLITHWKDTGDLSVLSNECDLYLKIENTQVTGKLTAER
jgi:hypothetical protein